MIDDETFFAWIDGELTGAEAARVEAAVEADPALARRAREHRALRGRLSNAFDGLLDAPVPEHLSNALKPQPQVISLAAAKRARALPSAPQWAAMAATLAVGVFIGTLVPERGAAPIKAHGGKLYAAAALNDALETQLASAPAGDVRIGLTFRDRSGSVCRTFTQRDTSGLACREDGRWQLRGLFGGPGGESAQYRMAAGADPRLMDMVDSEMAGEPFDAAAEKAAEHRGWK